MKIKYAVILIVLLYCNNLFSQALSGIYTIGGTSPNYATVAAAVSDLQTKGISASVVFNIRNGTYIESTTIPQITGSSPTNTITFQSELGDSTAVTLKFTTSFVLYLSGADNMIFKKLTFEGPQSGTSYNLLTMDNGSCNNKFVNNVFKGNPAANSVAGDIVLDGDYKDTANVFMYNVFKYGYRGIYFYTNSVGKGQGLVISNNEFYDNNYTPVTATYQNGIIINSNKITNTVGKCPYGIYLNYVDKVISIQKNIISLSSMSVFGMGIYLNTCIATATARSLVSNNFVSISGATVNGYGINLQDARYINVYNNSINLFLKKPSTNYALNVASGSLKIKVFNNSMVSMGSDKIFFYYNLSVDSSDYNNFYTGTNFFYHQYKSTNYWLNSLQEWKDSIKHDYNSITTNPYYLSFSDLHLSTVDLNNKGLPRTEITTDIDGQSRSTSTPDIGADEYTPTLLDASAVVEPFPLCNSTQNIQITLKNSGGIQINQATINWSVNGVTQTPYNWSGSLASGAQTQVNVGTASLNLLVPNTIYSWTTLPNNQADQFTVNDSSSLQNMYVSLNGTYTIGGASPDFTSVKSFCNVINKAGVCGPVTVNIRNGTYNDSLNLSPKGTSAVNTVLIRGESLDSSLVIIQKTTGSSSLILSYTQYITVQHIRFLNQVVAGAVVQLGKGLHHISIKNCAIEGTVFGTPTKPFGIYGPVDSALNVENVFIYNTNESIQMFGNISSPRIIGVTIKNSKMGIVHIETADNVKITGSSFNDAKFWYVDGFYITGNTAFCFDVNSTSPLFLRSCKGSPGNYSLIANNFLINLRTDTIVSGALSGARFHDCTYYNFINNNISVKNFYNQPGPSTALAITNTFVNPTAVFKNNVFANLAVGNAVDIRLQPDPSLNIIFDHNDYYVWNKTPLVFYSRNPVPIYLKDIKNILLDTAAISVDPGYVNLTSDLHVTEPVLNNTGIPFLGILNDIDLEPRDPQNPDIGADEFDALPYAPLSDTTKWCMGTGLLLDAGNPQASYLWSTGATTQKITVSSSGQYWVTVTNGLGSVSDTTMVAVVPVPLVNLGNDTTITTSQSLILNAGAGYSSYLWSNGATTSTITVNGGTLGVGTYTYTVMATNAYGCSKSDTIKVNVDAATGITDVSGNFFSIYYDAGKNLITVQSTMISSVSKVRLYTVSAQVASQDIYFDGNSISINTVGLSSGLYILELQTKEKWYHTKLVIE